MLNPFGWRGDTIYIVPVDKFIIIMLDVGVYESASASACGMDFRRAGNKPL